MILFSLAASDARFSQKQLQLHDQMSQYYQNEPTPALDWWHRPYLSGDWNQVRPRLSNLGVTVETSFTTDIVGNPYGGKARGISYAGSYGTSVRIDLEQMVGWKGGQIFSSATWRSGTSLSSKKIGNQFPVQQVYGSQTVKLNELYLRQQLFHDTLEIKAGRLDPCNDFLASPFYGQFVNNGFDGNPISIFFNVPITAYPNATWGAYLYYAPFKRLSTKWAVYNANSYIQKNKYHGINFTFNSTNGVIWITEWCLLVNQEAKDRGMQGNYKVGFFYMTGSKAKFSGGHQSGDPCLYFLFDQMIYRRGGAGSDQGLTPFVAVVLMPQNRNLFPFFLDAGLCYKGIIPSRPDDTASFGYIYGKYSPDQVQADPQNFETIYELNYWIQWSPWLSVVPDVQYIVHPKGRDIPNALVIGAQISVVL